MHLGYAGLRAVLQSRQMAREHVVRARMNDEEYALFLAYKSGIGTDDDSKALRQAVQEAARIPEDLDELAQLVIGGLEARITERVGDSIKCVGKSLEWTLEKLTRVLQAEVKASIPIPPSIPMGVETFQNLQRVFHPDSEGHRRLMELREKYSERRNGETVAYVKAVFEMELAGTDSKQLRGEWDSEVKHVLTRYRLKSKDELMLKLIGENFAE